MTQPRAFLASVFDDGLRKPLVTRCPSLIWDPRNSKQDGRTIEDICRSLIRKSEIFVAVFDDRGGAELAFAGNETPVTVLEIELIQALFEQMPIYIFTLPGFDRNERLHGLVDLARKQPLVRVIDCPKGVVTERGRRLLREETAVRIARVVNAHNIDCKEISGDTRRCLEIN